VKPILFVGSSLVDLSAFPEAARREAGFDLWQVQLGAMPRDFKPMPVIGLGAYEVRIKQKGEWRVIYVARLSEAIYVLHCFQKTTTQTAPADVDLPRRRYRQIGGQV
jgi:phage-related protein